MGYLASSIRVVIVIYNSKVVSIFKRQHVNKTVVQIIMFTTLSFTVVELFSCLKITLSDDNIFG